MIIDVIKSCWEKQIKYHHFESYWLFDLHGTIIKPNHIRGNYDVEYYPYAKETLQIITRRKDIRTIVFTSSYPDEIIEYNKQFIKDKINFKYYNSNPEICNENGMFGYYASKPYFDVMLEDKAGFNPLIEWKEIYDLLNNADNFIPPIEWKNPKLP